MFKYCKEKNLSEAGIHNGLLHTRASQYIPWFFCITLRLTRFDDPAGNFYLLKISFLQT